MNGNKSVRLHRYTDSCHLYPDGHGPQRLGHPLAQPRLLQRRGNCHPYGRAQLRIIPSPAWSGGATGTSNPVTITMNGNKSVTASFTQSPVTYILTVTAANGSVTRSPNKASYNAGETVTLTAVPNSGYTFSGWSGDASGSNNPLNIIMNANKTVAAVFTQSAPEPDPLITDLLKDAVYSKLEKQAFNGIDDYVSIPTTNWNLTGTTIALWVNPSVVAGSHYIFGHTVGVWSNRIQLYIRNDNWALIGQHSRFKPDPLYLPERSMVHDCPYAKRIQLSDLRHQPAAPRAPIPSVSVQYICRYWK